MSNFNNQDNKNNNYNAPKSDQHQGDAKTTTPAQTNNPTDGQSNMTKDPAKPQDKYSSVKPSQQNETKDACVTGTDDRNKPQK